MQSSTQFQVYSASAGSGKTFTLVKEYLKILLGTDDIFRFQNILAITFTNKAAAEMKTRVLDSLKGFYEGIENDLGADIINELEISKDTFQKRSKLILNSILQNYSAFNITTIDSFTYRIIRSFSFDLGLSMNFEVEMDAKSLLDEAVDLLISKIGQNEELTKTLIEFSLDKANNDKSWDISIDLKEFAKILLNENDQFELKKIEDKEIQDFTALKKELRKQQLKLEIELKEVGNSGMEIISSMNLEHNDFYRSMLPNHFKNLSLDILKAKFFDQSKLRERIEENTFYTKSKPEEIKNSIEQILNPLLDLYNKSEKLFQQFTLNELVLKGLIPLAVLKHINNSLTEIKEQNNIRLNAEFNQIISEQIKNEPAPFIYERIGEKFRYYFIDEMQDTSLLQWQNLIPLIENSLSSETENNERGSLMLVGDAKQAIYRWRGGKAEQFINLANSTNPFSIPKTSYNLETNYRSFSEIIDFNNRFFTHISNFLSDKKYKDLYKIGNHQITNSKKGGYVQLSFIEKEEESLDQVYSKKIVDIIQNLDSSFNLRDVCVLVRKKKQGITIANYLSEQNIDIVSSETLMLKNNPTIVFIVNVLTFLQFPDKKEACADALYFLCEKKKIALNTHLFIETHIHKSNDEIFLSLQEFGIEFHSAEFFLLPFYDSIEYLIRCFELIDDFDVFVQAFLDVVLECQRKKGVNLEGFLEFWDRKNESLSIAIPEGQNAVKIMTIHKSKGLEFPVVIYPYDLDIYNQIKPKIWYSKLEDKGFLNFETSLVDYSKKVAYTSLYGEDIYENRRQEIQLDNLNLLYVALTRPKEQLYIISEMKSKNNELLQAKFYSDFFIDFLKSLEPNNWSDERKEYSFGASRRSLIQQEKEIEFVGLQQEKFISSSWKDQNISIVNASKLWNTEKEEAISYGNLMHEVLSKIISRNDIESSVERLVNDGIINPSLGVEIQDKIYQVVNHPSLSKYFKSNVQIFCEQEIMTSSRTILIPDRVVIDKNTATILDYKTGIQEKKHETQIRQYADSLEEIGYKVIKRILVYIGEQIKIEEVSKF